MKTVPAQFPKWMLEKEANQHIMTITNALWYIDGSVERINNRAKNTIKVSALPVRFV